MFYTSNYIILHGYLHTLLEVKIDLKFINWRSDKMTDHLTSLTIKK